MSTPPRADLDSPKFFDWAQPKVRRRVARISAIAFLYLTGCAAWVLWTRRPVPFPSLSSNIWIDLLNMAFPQMFLLNLLHYLVLATCAAGAFVAVTIGHVDPPGNPMLKEVKIWRRQSRRIDVPSWIYAIGFAAAALAAHRAGFSFLTVLLEAPATGFALYAAALRWIPTTRRFVYCAIAPQFEGMSNILIIGGGPDGWRGKSITIIPAQLRMAERRATPWEYVCGISSLVLHYVDRNNVERTVVIYGFGSTQLTEDVCAFLNGPWKVSRPAGSHPINFALQEGKYNDPILELKAPENRKVKVW